MLDYLALYRAAIAADEAAEMARAAPKDGLAWRRAFREQHRLGWLEFLEVLWRLRAARNRDDAVQAAGTITLAGAFLAALETTGCLRVSAAGDIAWHSPLFPAIPEPGVPPPTLPALPEYGQLVASPDSSARRVGEMLRPLPPFGPAVLFLGDDDLTSLHLAAQLSGEIVVADLDARVLDRVASFKPAPGTVLRAVTYDVTTPLPATMTGLFDYVHCDPVDDGPWLAAWLERALQALRVETGVRLFLNVSPRRLGIRLPGVHRYLQHHGLLLERQVTDCSRYEIAQSHECFMPHRRPASARSIQTCWCFVVPYLPGHCSRATFVKYDVLCSAVSVRSRCIVSHSEFPVYLNGEHRDMRAANISWASKRYYRGGWLPADEHVLSAFRMTLKEHAKQRREVVLAAPVQELNDLIEDTPILRMHLTQAICEAIALEVTHPEIRLGYSNIRELMVLIDTALTRSLPFSKSVLVGCPITALLAWPMSRQQGLAFFQFRDVNAQIKRVLDHWCRFLDSGESRGYLNTASPDGCFSREASASVDMSLYVSDPAGPFYGFASWNDFFTRRFRPGVRPVAGVGDPHIVTSACEASPYRLQRGVALLDRFWIKAPPYSLRDLFTAQRSDLAERFVGGTVYQAFLEATSYHRWHAPVDGLVVAAYVVAGTYFGDAPSQQFDSADSYQSLGYITSTATRAIIVIDTNHRGLGLVACVFVGMGEVSSCCIRIAESARVTKGEELGYFQFGGSTYCLIFQPEAQIEFFPKLLLDDESDFVEVNAPLAKVAL